MSFTPTALLLCLIGQVHPSVPRVCWTVFPNLQLGQRAGREIIYKPETFRISESEVNISNFWL